MLSSRPFQKIIIQAGENIGFSFRAIEFNHIYFAAKGNVWFILKDVDLGLNTTASGSIAASKPSAYLVLKDFNIPSVFHQVFINPTSPYSNQDVFKEAQKLLESHGTIVVKPEKGFLGTDVYKVDTQEKLQEIMKMIFQKDQNVTIAPFYEYDVEYRVVVLDSEAKIVFGKKREASWKHNLADGASIEFVNYDEAYVGQLSQLAVRAANAVGLNFCSVDIIKTPEGYAVLEVNGQVYLADYARASEESLEETILLYEEAFELKHIMLRSMM